MTTASTHSTAYAILCTLCALFLSNCAPHFEEEEENPEQPAREDPAALLDWQGEREKFSIDPESGIRLDDPQKAGGTAYIAFPSTRLLDTRWEVEVKLAFNPSAQNFARFFLAASAEQLPAATEGYYVQIGGEQDNVSLHRVAGGKHMQLAASRELMKGDNSPHLFVKVECDRNGWWTLWTRREDEPEYVKEPPVADRSVARSSYCGLYCVYTKSRSDGFVFQQLRITEGVEAATGTDAEPDDEPEPSLPTGDGRGLLLFNEVMYDPAPDGAEYIEIYNPGDTDVTLPSVRLLKMHATGEVFANTVLRQPGGTRPLVFPAKGRRCFTASPGVLMQKHGVTGTNLVEVPEFPQLNNNGGYLAIVTDEEEPRIIDTCSFLNRMHDAEGDTRGIALEKKAPELPSKVNDNWHSSRDATGGSPGAE